MSQMIPRYRLGRPQLLPVSADYPLLAGKDRFPRILIVTDTETLAGAN